MFWSVGWPLLRAEGFFCNLDILYGGLGIGKLQFLIKKKLIFFSAVIFFQFLVIKARIWIRIGLQPQTMDPDPNPEKMNTDPKPCFWKRVVLLNVNLMLMHTHRYNKQGIRQGWGWTATLGCSGLSVHWQTLFELGTILFVNKLRTPSKNLGADSLDSWLIFVNSWKDSSTNLHKFLADKSFPLHFPCFPTGTRTVLIHFSS